MSRAGGGRENGTVVDQFLLRGQAAAPVRAEQIDQRPCQTALGDDRVRIRGELQGSARASVGEPGKRCASRGVCDAALGEDLRELVRRDGTHSDAGAATDDGGQQLGRIVRGKHDDHRVGRLLERLEQRVLGVVVEPMRFLDERDPEATFERQQRELTGKSLHLADADLLSGALWRESMKVRVIAVLNLAAGDAFAARPIERIWGEAQQPRSEIQGECGFAHPLRPYEQECVGRLATFDGALDQPFSGRMSARPGACP